MNRIKDNAAVKILSHYVCTMFGFLILRVSDASGERTILICPPLKAPEEKVDQDKINHERQG